ncbi:MAG: tRNA (N6-threonylcarbamoyladenosine(37)-N6)-methyltransferase TrmO [Candidatus Bathyarchaeia archaeon]|nr:tRNA (N6-threonylcarbamoyladenosine(37)-N6)-methyltransferase TrmO [Candidatus Bathyarchaeota archaeon]
MHFHIRPIGIVHVNMNDEEVKANWPEGVEGVIEVYEEYAQGLEGIDGFSHLIIIAYMHKISEEQRRVLKVRPKRLRLLGIDLDRLPEVGVFCTDSPHRPNPLALSIVEFIERRGRLLRVRHLDLFDGTPVLDIKPYTPSRRIDEIRLPTWYQKAIEEVRAKYPDLKDF